MKIRKFNEDVEHKHINPMEVCEKCGEVAVHIVDSTPLYCPNKFESDGMNFDDEQYTETICGNCGHKENILGKITWTPSDKQKEYAGLISKGINPVEMKKYNL